MAYLDPDLSDEMAASDRELLPAELNQLLNEALMLQQRLDAGLDYFTKPLGWIPGLSFEVNQTVYDNQIDSAIGCVVVNAFYAAKDGQ